jgi:hypothetical protein
MKQPIRPQGDQGWTGVPVNPTYGEISRRNRNPWSPPVYPHETPGHSVDLEFLSHARSLVHPARFVSLYEPWQTTDNRKEKP